MESLITVCLKKTKCTESIDSSKERSFYKYFIKSKFLYELQTYSSASESCFKKLNIVQNEDLCIITGLRRTLVIYLIINYTKPPKRFLLYQAHIYPIYYLTII